MASVTDASSLRRHRTSPPGFGLLRSFCVPRVPWATGITTAACLTYGGGVFMFWFHAIHRGEQGPAINDAVHWLLDSTLGFLGMLPAILALVCTAAVAAERRAGQDGARRRRVYAVVVGVSFAVLTGPGPYLHNLIAGAGTPLAEAITALVGTDPTVAARNAHSVHRSAVQEGLLQVVLGVPVYTAWAWLAAGLVRPAGGQARRVPSRPAGDVIRPAAERYAPRPAA